MFCEIGSRPAAGRDRNRARAERFAAGDIARRIADDVDLRGIELVAVFLASACACKRTELIAVVMIVGEGAEFEEMPDAVMLQFQLGAAHNVAGEKGENDLGAGSEFSEKLNHAGESASDAIGKLQRQVVNVGVEKRGHVNWRRIKAMFLQDVFDDAGIGHAGDLDIGEVVFDLEAFLERAMQRKDAGVTGMDQGSIDIEKEKTLIQNFGFRIAP